MPTSTTQTPQMIDPKDFSYKATMTGDIQQVGSFTWDLFFQWKGVSPQHDILRQDETDPLM